MAQGRAGSQTLTSTSDWVTLFQAGPHDESSDGSNAKMIDLRHVTGDDVEVRSDIWVAGNTGGSPAYDVYTLVADDAPIHIGRTDGFGAGVSLLQAKLASGGTSATVKWLVEV